MAPLEQPLLKSCLQMQRREKSKLPSFKPAKSQPSFKAGQFSSNVGLPAISLLLYYYLLLEPVLQSTLFESKQSFLRDRVCVCVHTRVCKSCGSDPKQPLLCRCPQ